MGKTKKIGPGGGLRSRYGSTVRRRYIEVVSEARKRHRCSQCGMLAVKRISVGIWRCRRCGFTFTGGAYVPSTKLGVTSKRNVKSLSKK